jgi:hypothetical protein
MSDRIIGNNKRDVGPNEGDFDFALIQFIHVLPVIFLPEDQRSQNIISVLQFVYSPCIDNPVQKVISVY